MKKSISILLAIILVLAQLPNVGLAYSEYAGTPNISITSQNTFTTEAGEAIDIPIKIKNTGTGLANDISATLDSHSSGKVYTEGSYYDSIGRLREGSSGNLNFKVRVDKLAEEQNYELKLNISYYPELEYSDLWPGDPGYVAPTEPKKISTTEIINIRVTNSKVSPQLTIKRVDVMPSSTVDPGKNFSIGFELQNNGVGPANDVKLSLSGLSNETFALASGLNSKTVNSIEPGKTSYIFFDLKSSSNISSGSHKLTLNLNYKDIKNTKLEDNNDLFISVSSNKGKSSSLIIKDIKYPTGSLGQNKEVDINFDLRNQGQSKAQNIIITATSQDTTGLVPKTVSTIKLNSLEANTTEKINFKFLTTKNGETKNYPIEINVEYEDSLSGPNEKSSVNQFIGIFVVAPEAPGDPIQSTPRLIIDKYVFEPNLVKAGENFQMHLSFFNTNSAKTVKNIKIFLTAEANSGGDPNSPSSGSSVFTPVDSSNTFYIDSIPPKGRVEKTITMFTIPDAVAKTHMITANFEYEDTAGEAYTATELIGVPVIQQSRLEIGELSHMPEAFIGDYSPISLEFYNTGKVTLYNMMVKLEGDFQTESGSYYIGNFEAGSSEFFEGMVIPSQPGPLEGAVVFTYEDSTGQEQEVRKEFSLNVMDMPMMEEYPDDFPPMDEGPGGIKGILKSKLLWGSIILILGGFGGFKFWKKKKQEKEDEELALDE